jgi:hypothetical protein
MQTCIGDANRASAILDTHLIAMLSRIYWKLERNA